MNDYGRANRNLGCTLLPGASRIPDSLDLYRTLTGTPGDYTRPLSPRRETPSHTTRYANPHDLQKPTHCARGQEMYPLTQLVRVRNDVCERCRIKLGLPALLKRPVTHTASGSARASPSNRKLVDPFRVVAGVWSCGHYAVDRMRGTKPASMPRISCSAFVWASVAENTCGLRPRLFIR
jgi:hypothetical protein